MWDEMGWDGCWMIRSYKKERKRKKLQPTDPRVLELPLSSAAPLAAVLSFFEVKTNMMLKTMMGVKAQGDESYEVVK